MARGNGRLAGAITAQILGQAVAGWSLLAHAMDWDRVSVWVVVPLVAAIAAPFRHDGSLRDRATGNFSAAIVIAGLLVWEVALGGLTSGGAWLRHRSHAHAGCDRPLLRRGRLLLDSA